MPSIRNTLLILASILGSIFSLFAPIYSMSISFGKLTPNIIFWSFWISGVGMALCVWILYKIAKQSKREEDIIYLKSFSQGMITTFILIAGVTYWIVASIR